MLSDSDDNIAVRGILPLALTEIDFSNTPIAMSMYWGLIAVPSLSYPRSVVDFVPLENVVPMSLAYALKLGPQSRHPGTFSIQGPAIKMPCSVKNESQRVLMLESLGRCSTSMTTGPDLAFTDVLADAEPVLLVADAMHHSVHILDVGERKHAGFLATPGLLKSPSRLACRNQYVVVQTKRKLLSAIPVYFVFEYCTTPSEWQVKSVFKGFDSVSATCVRFHCGSEPIFLAAYPGDDGDDMDHKGTYCIATGLSHFSTVKRDDTSTSECKCINIQIVDSDDTQGYFIARTYLNDRTQLLSRMVQYVSWDGRECEVIFRKMCHYEYLNTRCPTSLFAHPDGGVLIKQTSIAKGDREVQLLLWAGTASQLRKVNMSKTRIAWMATVIRTGALCSKKCTVTKCRK